MDHLDQLAPPVIPHMKEKYRCMISLMHQILTEMGVPDYFYTQSKHKFSSHQLIILLVLRQYESKSYRSFVQWLLAVREITYELGLHAVPHHTTLQKASARIDERMLHEAIRRFINHVDAGEVFGIDVTGFEAGHAARYYTWRARIRRGFTKVSLCSDMTTQIVCAAVVQNHPVSHDTKHVRALLSDMRSVKPVKTLVLDRGTIQNPYTK